MKKKKKGPEGIRPQIPIGPQDLLAIENILSGNIGYLRNAASLSPRNVIKIRQLEDIRTRIQFLRLGGDGEIAPVSRNDILVIREAMLTFVQVMRRIVPPSSERDETLRCVDLLRKYLEKMMTS